MKKALVLALFSTSALYTTPALADHEEGFRNRGQCESERARYARQLNVPPGLFELECRKLPNGNWTFLPPHYDDDPSHDDDVDGGDGDEEFEEY